MSSVYVLKDPITNEIRYVGQTRTSLDRRLMSHVTDRTRTAKRQWVLSLAEQDKKPLIEAIEFTTDLLIREAFWIDSLYNAGCALFNKNGGRAVIDLNRLRSLPKKEKRVFPPKKMIYLYIKATKEHKFYSSLQAMFNDNTDLGVSKFTLDRFKFDAPYENLKIMVVKGETLGTGDVKRK